jgi:hypothetical protein
MLPVSTLQNSGSIIFILFREWEKNQLEFKSYVTKFEIWIHFHKNKMIKTHLNTLEMLNLVNFVFSGFLSAEPYEIH